VRGHGLAVVLHHAGEAPRLHPHLDVQSSGRPQVGPVEAFSHCAANRCRSRRWACGSRAGWRR
jgi:hypothetical protein